MMILLIWRFVKTVLCVLFMFIFVGFVVLPSVASALPSEEASWYKSRDCFCLYLLVPESLLGDRFDMLTAG